ncbi:MAG: GDP-L-fucose synthase [Myxococcales bacterium]|nr:GDP-L-fucose synthase [Myxococcales bacterium]
MDRSSHVFVAGHRGLVGSAILRRLRAEGFERVLTRPRGELDLTDGAAVQRFFGEERPEYVFLAAARVGGIAANASCPADFIRDNLLIQTHVIDAAWRHGARKLLFLGSSCIYPRLAPQPIREEHLLTGPLEPTNQAYAVAKIAGIEMCRAYREQRGLAAVSLMPTNLYGPGDSFEPQRSHVLPALIRRFEEARRGGLPEVAVWGTGAPLREFLHVDDLADAAVFLMRRYDGDGIINVGSGDEVSIKALVGMVADAVGYQGSVAWDTTKPDGTPRKRLDLTKLHGLGWRRQIPLREGLVSTVAWFREHHLGAE